MRLEAKDVLLLVALGALFSPALAQKIITDLPAPHTPAPNLHKKVSPPLLPPSAAVPKAAPAFRPLTSDEGLAVIAAALDAHIRRTTGEDCSHLVHTIYQKAGFPYEYINSWQLYDGDAHFRRVWRPQPGDLVVWPGHVGIVVAPAGHAFFSELSSTGQGTASYDADYWRNRGRARFYRYLKPVTAEGRALLARAAHPRPVQTARARPLRVRLIENSDPPEEKAAGPSIAAGEAAADSDFAYASLLNSPRPQPDEVRDAILLSLRHPQASAPAGPAQGPPRPLVVFDELAVEHVRLRGERGWAQVRLRQVGLVQAGRADLGKRIVRAQWGLRRHDDASWEIAPPHDAVYLSREAAVPILVHQLAAITDNQQQEDAGTRAAQKASLARLLSTLLEP